MHTRDLDALPEMFWRLVLVMGVLGLLALGAWLDGGDELRLQQALAQDAADAQAQEAAREAERQRVRTELVPAVRRAYQQGLQEGAERERARVAALQGRQR